jgi:hypothetical protein
MPRDGWKAEVRRMPGFDAGWGALRRWQLRREYRARREGYAAEAARRGLRYDQRDTVKQIQQRLAARGYAPAVRQAGQVHTFAFIPRFNWHASLYPDLEELGPVTAFDYVALGYSWQEFWRRDTRAAARRREMLAQVLPALRTAHARRPVDWVFVYASGVEITAELIREITAELGIPVVTMCLDDKQSWTGPMLDGQRSGQIDLAEAVDLSWTSARVACEWYLAEGGRPIYMPEGFDAHQYRPMNVKRDLSVSFIGGAYGYRPSVISHLEQHGIDVHVFGPGWGAKGCWADNPVAIINRSQINLGLGGIGYSEELTNVKGRDFEIPGTGGGLYLTSFNPDLAQHFHIGREIVCYRNRDEMIELIRYYLARPDEAEETAHRGRERSLAEHRWLHRYTRVCQVLGILPDQRMACHAEYGVGSAELTRSPGTPSALRNSHSALRLGSIAHYVERDSP